MSYESDLRKAVNKEIVVSIKYYPNIDGQQRTGWRNILPLDLFSHKGKQYLFTWFIDGSSVSGDTGYRLFFLKNVRDLRLVDTTKQQPFAMKVTFNQSDIHTVKQINIQYQGKMMALRGQVE